MLTALLPRPLAGVSALAFALCAWLAHLVFGFAVLGTLIAHIFKLSWQDAALDLLTVATATVFGFAGILLAATGLRWVRAQIRRHRWLDFSLPS